MHQKNRRCGWDGMRVLCVLAIAAGLGAAGCAAPPKSTVRPDDTVLGRRLYDTGPAYIYASSQAAANETGSDLVAAMRDYQKATGRVPAGKGLLIVTDKNDAPYADRNSVLRMTRHLEDMGKFQGPATLPADLEQKLRKADEELGPEVVDKIFLIKPATTDTGEAVKLWGLADRPAAKATWVLAVPTGEMAQQAIHLAIEKAMSKKDVSIAARVLVAPLLLFVEGKAKPAAETDRQVSVFLMLACNDTGLDLAKKKAAFQKYQKDKEQDVMGDMPMLGNTQKASAASQPASTRPTTAASKP